MIQKQLVTRSKAEPLKIIPLGGLGEVTRNMMVFEYGNDIVIVDMGLQFPEEDMLGIDYIIPNIAYLEDKIHKIRGVMITHGHYDHIGAIPHLIGKLGNPVIYATTLTKGMILKRQEDFPHAPKLKIETITPQSKLALGCFKIQFFHVNHNIPDAVGVVLDTPFGRIVHTGDFKFDPTPLNELPMDVSRLAQIGAEDVLLLMSDSTNAEQPGYQLSEKTIQERLEEIFKQVKGRIIAGTFASLLNRVQQLIFLAEKYNRRVIIDGYSMKMNVAVAKELGYLKTKKHIFISPREVDNYPDNQILVICTGAQGEDRAVLMRIANNEHRLIKLKPADSIIFSSSVIPGNESTVQRLKDALYRQVAKVYHYQMMDIHTGGHAKQEELKLMISLIKPQFFIPIEGNYSMLKTHAELAILNNLVKKDNVLVPEDGNIIEVYPNRVRISRKKVPVNYIMVDGLGVGDVGNVVLRDRQVLAEDGMFVVITVVDTTSGKILTSPDIISRGFVYLRESKQLLADVRKRVIDIVDKAVLTDNKPNWVYVRDEIREKIGQFLFVKTKRRPMILPVVIEV